MYVEIRTDNSDLLIKRAAEQIASGERARMEFDKEGDFQTLSISTDFDEPDTPSA